MRTKAENKAAAVEMGERRRAKAAPDECEITVTYRNQDAIELRQRYENAKRRIAATSREIETVARPLWTGGEITKDEWRARRDELLERAREDRLFVADFP